MTYQHSRLRRTAKRTDEREGWVSLAPPPHMPPSTDLDERDPAHTELDRAAALLAVQHHSPRGDCRRLEGGPARTGVGGSRTTSSPSTPSVGPGRSRAAYASGAVLESRSRQPTLPRDPQQANTRDPEIFSQNRRVCQRRRRARCPKGKREVRPEARLAVAPPPAAARSGAHSRPSEPRRFGFERPPARCLRAAARRVPRGERREVERDLSVGRPAR